MSRSTRWKIAIVGVVGLVVLSGCLSMSVEVDVNNDGTINSMDMEMTMDQQVYQFMQSDAQDQGYDSVEDSFRDEINEDAWESVETDVSESENEVTLTISASNGDPAEIDFINVTVEEDSITYVDSEGFSSDGQTGDGDLGEYMDQIEMEYTLHMPGEVTDTTGEIQDDGTTVMWTLQDHQGVEQFEATSERSEEDGSSGIPGFGGALAIAALLMTLVAFSVWRRR